MASTWSHGLAERVGFEPTNTREDVTGIPVQRLRPLGHLSNAHRTMSAAIGWWHRQTGIRPGARFFGLSQLRNLDCIARIRRIQAGSRVQWRSIFQPGRHRCLTTFITMPTEPRARGQRNAGQCQHQQTIHHVQAAPACCSTPPLMASRSAARTRARCPSDNHVSGSRIPSPISPMSANAHFTGMGLASANNA